MIVSIQGVTFTYPGGEDPALRDLDLEITQGEFVALIGNNGSGKTSLCKLLTGLIPHYFQGDYEGTVVVDGMDTWETRVAELARHVGYVYQDFENQLLKPRVFEDVAFAPLNYGLEDFEERAEEALATMELSHLRDRIIWELSGGESHLVALTGALALRPDIVVVDEPISHLDPINAAVTYEKLALLNREMGKTVIVIEHQPGFIGTYCDAVVLIKQGHVQWKLPVREALSRVEELERNDIFAPQVTRIAQRLAEANGDLEPEELPINLEEAVAYFCERPVAQADDRRAAADETSDQEEQGEPIIAFHDVSHYYTTLNKTRRDALRDLSLTLRRGQRIALVGANGAGKSTLLKLIAGLERPKAGRVSVRGKDTRTTSPEQLADEVALVYQTPQEMFIEDSVRRDIAFYLHERGISNAEEIVEKALEDFRLKALQDRDGRLLSGGQMRRASLAIGACMRPQVMLLDEPTSSLDVSNRRQVIEMLRTLERWVETVVIATHDMELVAEWSTRVVVLRDGRVIADAPPRAIFGDPDLVARARIHPPQVVRLSNALDIKPVHLSVESFVDHALRARQPRERDDKN